MVVIGHHRLLLVSKNISRLFTDFSQCLGIKVLIPQLRTATKEKIMNKPASRIYAALLLPLLLLTCAQSIAGNPNYEYHVDARMQHALTGPLKDAYGYVYVVTDKKGHGVVRVMFSNGTALDHASFNARVKFLDANGELIREEHFERRIEAAGSHGAAERSLSKLVDLSEFAAVRVDFYLSDIPVATLAKL
jgi:hypothetical protein